MSVELAALINLTYLVASVLFILGIKGLTHPRTAVRGNLTGATGMLLAIVATLANREVFGAGMQGIGVILIGIIIGAGIGATLALKIQMTAMPQMVALLNGFGGGASVLVAGAALFDATDPSAHMTIATVASGIIGGVTLFGSLVAFDKLQEFVLPGKPIHFPGQQLANIVLGMTALSHRRDDREQSHVDQPVLGPGRHRIREPACS